MVVTKSKEVKDELVKKYDIEDSPFTVVKVDGKVFGTMGQYRITEEMKSVTECKKELKKFSWNRVMQVIMLLNEQLNSNDIIKKN